MWMHKFCPLFQTFMTHNFLSHHAIAMQFSTLITHLIGYIIQVTECKCSIPGPVLRYDLLYGGVDHTLYFHRPGQYIMLTII